MKNYGGRIQKIIRKCKKTREIIRLIVLILIYVDLSITAIASIIGIHRVTVYRTRKRYKIYNNNGFSDKQRPGRRRKVTKEFEYQLIKIFNTPPRALGYAQNYWTLELLRIHMQALTKISVCKNTIRNILKRNGFSCKRPKQRIHSPDPDYLEKKRRIKRLIKTRSKNEVILYVDEHDAHLNPSIRRCYQKHGRQMNVYTPGKNQKLYIFGAYCPYRKCIVQWKIFDRKRSKEFFEFLKYLIKKYSGKRIILILDNFCIHRSKKLEKLLDEHSWMHDCIRFVWLPTYAPELNPIERAWGTVKMMAESNYLFKDLTEFYFALSETFKYLQSKPMHVTHSRTDKQILTMQKRRIAV
jgi:transposase